MVDLTLIYKDFVQAVSKKLRWEISHEYGEVTVIVSIITNENA